MGVFCHYKKGNTGTETSIRVIGLSSSYLCAQNLNTNSYKIGVETKIIGGDLKSRMFLDFGFQVMVDTSLLSVLLALFVWYMVLKRKG